MSPEFTTIELYEEPDRNWRRAYHDQFEKMRDDYRRARARGDTTPRYFGWKKYVPKDLSDAQIDELARRMAEASIERAIITRRVTQTRRRMRGGLAL